MENIVKGNDISNNKLLNNFTVRHLTTDDVEQYNDLLRYAFQITEQELMETGWDDDDIKQSKFPVLERAERYRMLRRRHARFPVCVLSAGNEHIRQQISYRLRDQRLHISGVYGPWHNEPPYV